MGTLVCQTCGTTIEYFDCEKVTTLYSQCRECRKEKQAKK